MKTFRQLREAIASEENPEAKALRPRAKGEQDFADAHTREVTDYPAKKVGGDTKETDHQPNNGDRTPVQQGTSKLADKSGFKGNKTPMTRADKTQGEMKPVKTSPSAVQSPSFAESVFISAPVISESDEDVMEFELMNGDVIEINADIYNSIHEVFDRLTTGNQAVFKAAVNESVDSFERILDFVAEVMSEDE
jgi:hypothetical protein